MQAPLEIVFDNLDPSDALAAKVREHVAKLDRHADGIVGVRVAIAAPHRQHRRGNVYRVRIEVRVPGKDLVVSRDPGDRRTHQNMYVAIRDAFRAMDRQLKSQARQMRREVKFHVPPVQGVVARLLADRDHGFITTTDGRELYFHRNSVVQGRFADLAVGTPVELAVHGESEHGPQANTVRAIRPQQLRQEPATEPVARKT
jgi:ribosomal subunit interface protein